MIAHGLPIYIALDPVGMRFGCERLGGIVRERMQAEPRSRALFVFVGKRGDTTKVLTWDGTGVIVVSKKLDAGRSHDVMRAELNVYLDKDPPPAGSPVPVVVVERPSQEATESALCLRMFGERSGRRDHRSTEDLGAHVIG